MDIVLIVVGIVLTIFGGKKQSKEIKLAGTVILVLWLAIFTLGSMHSCFKAMPK